MSRQGARKFRFSNLPNKCFSIFEEMKNKNELCDVTIHVGNRSISAHRVILAAGIPYFRSIFSCKNEKKDINLPNIEPDVLACLIGYAYSCEVNINAGNVKRLLTASFYLSIEEVKEACCDFLSDGLEPESAWSIRELAINLDCPKLLADADCYIMENFNVIAQTESFLNYSLFFLKEIIEADDLNVDNEEQVMDAILRWVNEDPDDRKDDLPEMLYKIRIPLLDPLYLRNVVRKEEIIRTSASCRDIIDDGRDYNLFPQIREKGCHFRTEKRQNRNKFESEKQIYNRSIYKLKVKKTHSIEHFDVLKKRWVKKEREDFIFSGSGIHLENMMYFFHRSTTLQFDPRFNTYKMMRSMPTIREDIGTTGFKNKIYVCGGRTRNGGDLSVVECFDPESNEWATANSMSTSRSAISAVTMSDYIFTLGGIRGVTVLDYVERYDWKCDKWTYMSPMLTARCNACAATLNSRIYVCGGISSTGFDITAEVYDHKNNQWAFISSMNSVRCKFSLVSFKGKLYSVRDEDNCCSLVHNFDIYDPKRDKWTSDSSIDSNDST